MSIIPDTPEPVNFCIAADRGATGRVLTAYLDGMKVAAAAALPDATDRWCVVAEKAPEQSVHDDGNGYELVDGEPAARAALERIALQGGTR